MDTRTVSGGEPTEREQTLTLKNRRQLTLSGITDVKRFDDTGAVFDTVCGQLCVKGENLRVDVMDVEAGNVILKGTVHALGYVGDGAEKSGVFGKLFR